MAQPLQPPGWYPDPAGGGGQRYWNGQSWAPEAVSAAKGEKKSPRLFVLIALGSFLTGFLSFILMQLAFNAAANLEPSGLFETLGFALFALFLASLAGLLVGLIGSVVRSMN